MKETIIVLFMAVLVSGCAGDGDQDEASADPAHTRAAETTETPARVLESELSEQDRLNKKDPVGAYGEALMLTELLSIATLNQEPESYEGKLVRIEGTVDEVCPRRGCWVDMIEDQTGATIRVKVVDGAIVFPLSAKGRSAVVEGKVEKLEFNEEQARAQREHEAEERGETFDPESVTGPEVIWRIKGQGAEIKG